MASAVFPDHYINPKDKLNDPKWTLQMVKAIWDQFNTQSIKSFNKGVHRYNLNKLYALGKQPNDIYKPMFEITEDDNQSFMNLDFSPPAIIPKFKRIVTSRFAKMLEEFSITAEAIDPMAMQDKIDYEAEQVSSLITARILRELNIDPSGYGVENVDQVQDEEELAIRMEYGWKHDDAVQIEKSVDTVFSHERLKDKVALMRDYGFDTGLLAVKVYTDDKTGKVGFTVVDPNNVIVSPTKDPKFGDIWYVGEYKLITIDEIRREAGSDIAEEDLKFIAEKNAGMNGNPAFFGSTAVGAYAYDSCKVPVLDLEFLSEDRYVYETRIDHRGNPVRGKVDPKTKRKSDRKYDEEKRVVVYRAKWIVASDAIFNWGLKSDMPRRADSVWDTRLSYIMCAPEMNVLETSPIIENLIPIVDQITIAWYKLQNVMARARPKGIAIEIGALEDISMGDANDGVMTPISILDMFTKTGNLVYRRINLEGAPSNYKPIEELKNGLGTEAQEHFAVIQNFMGMIKDMIGFNDFTDGSTPDPKALNGVASMAVEGTNNATQHLLDAERFVIERLAEDVAIRVHDSVLYKKNSPYRNIVVHNEIRNINSYDGSRERVYNIVLNWSSDKLEKQKLETRIQQSMANKEITLADVLAIERIRNIKQAETMLAYRIRKNQETNRILNDQDKKSNAEASAMAARAAEEEKRKTLQMEFELEAKRIELEKEKEAALLILEYSLKSNNEEPKLANKKDIAKINNDAKHTLEKWKTTVKPLAA